MLKLLLTDDMPTVYKTAASLSTQCGLNLALEIFLSINADSAGITYSNLS